MTDSTETSTNTAIGGNCGSGNSSSSISGNLQQPTAIGSSNNASNSAAAASGAPAPPTPVPVPLVFKMGSPPEGAGTPLQGPPRPGAQIHLQQQQQCGPGQHQHQAQVHPAAAGSYYASAGPVPQPPPPQPPTPFDAAPHPQQQAAVAAAAAAAAQHHSLQHHPAAYAGPAAYHLPQPPPPHYRQQAQQHFNHHHLQQQAQAHHYPQHHHPASSSGGGKRGGNSRKLAGHHQHQQQYQQHQHPHQLRQSSSGSGYSAGHPRQQASRPAPAAAAASAAFGSPVAAACGANQFAAHWTPAQVSEGLAASGSDQQQLQVIVGQVRISQRNFEEAFVSHPLGDSDVLITSLLDRNRALNDDEVAVKIKPVSEWRVISLDIAGAGDVEGGGFATPTKNNSGQPPLTVQSVLAAGQATFAELFGDSFAAATDEEIGDALKSGRDPLRPLPVERIQRVGHVVAITRQVAHRRFVGHVKPSSGQMALFAPLDSRQPRCLIPRSDLPPLFATRPGDFEKTVFVAELAGDWRPEWRMPQARISRQLGDRAAGFNLQLETDIALEHFGIDSAEFDDAILAEVADLTADADAEVAGVSARRDFRGADWCVFTVDPETARDLDDAVHIRRLDDAGDLEVGVHIADVSHFVRPGSRVDLAARERATTTYMVQQAYPMLPRRLCEALCSLNPREDKLAFSVVWRIDPETAEVKSTWFGRSVIRSCCQLSYQHAQHFIDGHSDMRDEEGDGNARIEHSDNPATAANSTALMADLRRAGARVESPHTVHSVAKSVRQLHALAVKLRERRFSGGALRIDQPKLAFRLDPDTKSPVGFEVYELRDSNRMIEEFMLLANCSVAVKLREALPQLAFLRQHSPPSERALVMLGKTARALDVALEVKSSGELQASLSQAAGKLNPTQYHCLLNMCAKQMQLARYFCAGAVAEAEEFRHYALSVPLYTHFTSPIRRYADVIVHRQLQAALCAESGLPNPAGETEAELSEETVDSLTSQACVCNKKKKFAKEAGERSAELHFAAFLLANGPIPEVGVVLGVLDKALDVLLTRCGLVRRLYMDRQEHMLRKAHVFRPGQMTGFGRLTVHFNGCQAGRHVVSLGPMDTVEVTVGFNKDDPVKPILLLKPPNCDACNKE